MPTGAFNYEHVFCGNIFLLLQIKRTFQTMESFKRRGMVYCEPKVYRYALSGVFVCLLLTEHSKTMTKKKEKALSILNWTYLLL